MEKVNHDSVSRFGFHWILSPPAPENHCTVAASASSKSASGSKPDARSLSIDAMECFHVAGAFWFVDDLRARTGQRDDLFCEVMDVILPPSGDIVNAAKSRRGGEVGRS
jgi:hypothetical protein